MLLGPPGGVKLYLLKIAKFYPPAERKWKKEVIELQKQGGLKVPEFHSDLVGKLGFDIGN